MSHANAHRLTWGGPLVPVFAAAAAGIVVDRYTGVAVTASLAVTVLAGLAWSRLRRGTRRRAAVGAVLLAVAGLAAAHHHARWRWFPADNLGLGTRAGSQPVCLRAVALTAPRTHAAAADDALMTFPTSPRTTLRVRVTAVRNGRRWQRCSGRAVLTVADHLPHVGAGDRIQIAAEFERLTGPGNPGEFDRASWDRARRRLFRLTARRAASVRILKRAAWYDSRRLLAAIREDCRAQLRRYLPADRAGLAAALLLGTREDLAPEAVEPYFLSGTIHLLAISGLHVGMLAGVVLWPSRLGLWSRRTTFAALLAFVVSYAFLTDGRPPVVRAAVLIAVGCGGYCFGRTATPLNSLALAGLLLLGWNPCELFQTGSQFSFLAVATLIVRARSAGREPEDPIDRLIARTRPWPVRWCRRAGRAAWQLTTASLAVWLVTLPLMIYRFHLVAPLGLFLNPILWIPLAGGLFGGFGVIATGRLYPPLAWMSAACCDAGLRMLQACVDLASLLPAHYRWVPSPPLAWVVSCYGLLWVCVELTQRGAARAGSTTAGKGDRDRDARRSGRTWALQVKTWCRSRTVWRRAAITLTAAIWTSGLLSSLGPRGGGLPGRPERPLVCTFIAVGHGTAVLIELPENRTILYDAGHLGHPRTAARRISDVLWAHGVRRLDAIVISHADADHYNAIPHLLQRFPVTAVYSTPQMRRQRTAGLRQLRRAIEAAGVARRSLAANGTLPIPGAAQFTIVHPPAATRWESDNAASLVLQITYRGRTILLPGDIEGAGLASLLDRPPIDCDVLMAPHHGSAHSRPRDIVRWSRPEWVIISSGKTGSDLPAAATYRRHGARVRETGAHGAVRVRVSGGGIDVRCFRQRPWP